MALFINRRGVRASIIAILLCGISSGIAMAVQAPWVGKTVPEEYRVKAAFLFSFAKFVEWPPQTFRGAASPIVIGVLGGNPFGDVLEALIRKQTVNGRPLAIKRSRYAGDLKACHLVFISRSEQRSVRKILDQLTRASVLTVSDADGFLENGGVIQFVKSENDVRFVINQTAAEKAKLKISSKLLSLAQPVNGR